MTQKTTKNNETTKRKPRPALPLLPDDDCSGLPQAAARTPEGVAHPFRGGAPLKGWRPPVSNRYNHHLVDDSRALRGGAPLEGRRTARGAQARRAGAARGPQDVNVVGRGSLVEGPGAR